LYETYKTYELHMLKTS